MTKEEICTELDKYIEDMGIKRLYADKPVIIAEIKSAFFAGVKAQEKAEKDLQKH